jgi:predicted porin
MKKSLIALAVLAASGTSFAQSSVTVYGIADVFLASSSPAGVASTTLLANGGVSGSRYGFKGTEDLGGGLKANFVLENGFNIDSGSADIAGQAFSRYSYVGFSGGFGEVKLGKTGTAYDDISGAANSAFDSKLSAQNNVWISGNYAWNPANTIYYVTPTMGGVSAALSYSLDEKVAGSSSVTSMNVKYEGGPLYVGLAYQTEQPIAAGVASTSYTRLNGTYDLSVAKLLAGYGRVSAPGVTTTDWELGADVPVSAALTLSGGIARSSDDVAGSATRSGYGFAAAYSLSKRTTLYGGLNASTITTAGVDATSRTTAIGVKHTF